MANGAKYKRIQFISRLPLDSVNMRYAKGGTKGSGKRLGYCDMFNIDLST